MDLCFFLRSGSSKRYEIHWITLKKYVKAHTVRQLKGQTIHILPDPSLALGLLSGHFLASKRIRLLLHSLKPALVHAWGIEFPYAKACMNQPYSRLLSYQGALHAYCRESKMPFLAHLQAFWENEQLRHTSILHVNHHGLRNVSGNSTRQPPSILSTTALSPSSRKRNALPVHGHPACSQDH